MKRAPLRSAALIKLGSLSLACVIVLPPREPLPRSPLTTQPSPYPPSTLPPIWCLASLGQISPWSPLPTLSALTFCPPHSHHPYPTHLSPPLTNPLIQVGTIWPPGGAPDQVNQNGYQMALFATLDHCNSILPKSATGGRLRPSYQNQPPGGAHRMKAVDPEFTSLLVLILPSCLYKLS